MVNHKLVHVNKTIINNNIILNTGTAGLTPEYVKVGATTGY